MRHAIALILATVALAGCQLDEGSEGAGYGADAAEAMGYHLERGAMPSTQPLYEDVAERMGDADYELHIFPTTKPPCFHGLIDTGDGFQPFVHDGISLFVHDPAPDQANATDTAKRLNFQRVLADCRK